MSRTADRGWWLVPVLQLLVVSGVCYGYDRRAWMSGWSDADRNCRDTRQEVLRRQSVGPVTGDGCRVTTGFWFDPYSGTVLTQPDETDVDHVIPLGYADAHGGARWPKAKKRLYANDLTPGHLIAVSASLNRAKGDKGPSAWVPPWPAGHCAYGRAWQDIAKRWELKLPPADAAVITELVKECP